MSEKSKEVKGSVYTPPNVSKELPLSYYQQPSRSSVDNGDIPDNGSCMPKEKVVRDCGGIKMIDPLPKSAILSKEPIKGGSKNAVKE